MADDGVPSIITAVNSSMDRFVLARSDVARRVYGPNDILASARAAAAVVRVVESGPRPREYGKPEPCNC
jgi:hypothetical protein